MSILDSVRRDVAAAQAAANPTTDKAERKATQFWLNVGITLPGAAEDGSDLFVSLPLGIPLDDMKAAVVRGKDGNYTQLLQCKNALLEATQKAVAKLEPGERMILTDFVVEAARVSAPNQTGDANTNPLVRAMLERLGG